MATPARTVAAVVARPGAAPVVEEVALRSPTEGEVRVVLEASGICHSDVSLFQGRLTHDLPAVLGHEGVGVVAEVGPTVGGIRVGDRVVLSLQSEPCRRCAHCRRGRSLHCPARRAPGPPAFSLGGRSVPGAFRCGTLAQETVVRAEQAVKIDDDVPAVEACLLGCGVLTGFGAVFNTARVEPGAAVVVVGCGGVGAAIVHAARLAGAAVVVGVDTRPEQLVLARSLGATHAVGPDGAAAVVDLATEGVGADVAFEAVGSPQAFDQALALLGPGGLAVVVGAPPPGTAYEFDANRALFSAARIATSFVGGGDARRDVQRILDLRRSGCTDLGRLITSVLPLEAAPAALERLATGGPGTRTVVRLGKAVVQERR